MKNTQLPPVRVEASVRQEIEAVLRAGESLSEFVEKAALEVARRRKVQDEYLARGRVPLANAKQTGEFYDADQMLTAMQARLDARVRLLRDPEGKAGRSR
jgi:Arc/MetJ-type ribon-helix-helix transcriptional regulator